MAETQEFHVENCGYLWPRHKAHYLQGFADERWEIWRLALDQPEIRCQRFLSRDGWVWWDAAYASLQDNL